MRIISNIRVPVLAPDGKPLMPTKASRARRWIKEGKAKPLRTLLGIFAVQLTKEPSGRNTQEIVVGLDPGSKYSGVAVASKKAVFCGFNLELPDWVSKRMEQRRMLRRNRRQRKRKNKSKRKPKFLNRKGHRIPPSILSRKQMELRVVRELSRVYPISTIAVENVAYDHRRKKGGKHFSLVEVGKNWLFEELRKIADLKLFTGSQTAKERKRKGLKKSHKKSKRSPTSHVHDAISLCSLVLGEVDLTAFHFDIIRRPKYLRRQLHAICPSKGGIRRRVGGTATPYLFRKGDYVEVRSKGRIIRGWVSGYREQRKRVSLADFEWKRIGIFAVSRVRLLNRNKGLLVRR